VVAYGPLADHAKESLRRGCEVVVVGSFADDSYKKDGERRRQLVLEAQVIAPSLRFAAVQVRRSERHSASA